MTNLLKGTLPVMRGMPNSLVIATLTAALCTYFSTMTAYAVYAYDFEGQRYDVGDKLGFLKATVEFALRREDLGTEFRKYLNDVLYIPINLGPKYGNIFS